MVTLEATAAFYRLEDNAPLVPIVGVTGLRYGIRYESVELYSDQSLFSADYQPLIYGTLYSIDPGQFITLIDTDNLGTINYGSFVSLYVCYKVADSRDEKFKRFKSVLFGGPDRTNIHSDDGFPKTNFPLASQLGFVISNKLWYTTSVFVSSFKMSDYVTTGWRRDLQ